MDTTALDGMLAQMKQVIDPVYLVGGCVRDALLAQEPHDFDFTTPLVPDEIERRVREAGKRPYLAGKRFGTVGFKLQGKVVEVTTFRSETYPTPGRHPEVHFESELVRDLARRDFTFNALAYDGTLHDPFDGAADLANGLVRAVGDPLERMHEDPLRMLRAARFCAQFGFVCDEELIDALRVSKARLFDVAKQRWTVELTKLLCSAFPVEGLYVLAQSGLLGYLFPELGKLQTRSDVIRIARALGKVEREHGARWGVLCAHMAEAAKAQNRDDQVRLAQECVKRYAPYLRWSRAEEFETLAFLQEPWGFYIP